MTCLWFVDCLNPGWNGVAEGCDLFTFHSPASLVWTPTAQERERLISLLQQLHKEQLLCGTDVFYC